MKMKAPPPGLPAKHKAIPLWLAHQQGLHFPQPTQAFVESLEELGHRAPRFIRRKGFWDTVCKKYVGPEAPGPPLVPQVPPPQPQGPPPW